MELIGRISACIAGDHRYSSRVEVRYNSLTHVAHIDRFENGATGGMDGHGGADPFTATAGETVFAATPKLVLAAVKHSFDDVIRRYGKPTKNFTWYVEGKRKTGLNVVLVAEAMASATG